MNSASDKGLNFAAAALASGVGTARLRNYLDRNQVPHLDAVENRDGAVTHRRFSILDIVQLAIIGHLVSCGYNAKEADEIAFNVVRPDVLGLYRNMPPAAALAILAGSLIVWRDPEGGQPIWTKTEAVPDEAARVVAFTHLNLAAIKSAVEIQLRDLGEIE